MLTELGAAEAQHQMPILNELARPKVNLSLTVRGRRTDGYHEIESLVAFAQGVGDRVTFLPGGDPGVHASGPFALAISGENLVERTLRRLRERAPNLVLGAVHLEKTLPVAAGIGGGSADAAAVLRAVRRANPAIAGDVDWPAIAASLGADVPVCLADRPAFVSGIGEQVAPLPDLPRLTVVLANPLVAVPADKTAQVFRRLATTPISDELDQPPRMPPSFGSAADLVAWMRSTGNDLTEAAHVVMPALSGVLSEVEATPRCLVARLSGAGPTCFGVYGSAEAAAAAAAMLKQLHPSWWIAPAVLG